MEENETNESVGLCHCTALKITPHIWIDGLCTEAS